MNGLCLVDVWPPVVWIVSFFKDEKIGFFELWFAVVALGGIRAEDEYSEPNKRHTMSHPPEHIPDINSQSPAKKSPKEKKEKEKKEKVIVTTHC